MQHPLGRAAFTLSLVLSLSCGPPRRHRDAPPDAFDAAADRDGDRISDGDEGLPLHRDTDGDGVPDGGDRDADGDGLDDATEAGDADLRTPPRDADGDGVPDVIDLDSDDDGVLDADEGTLDGDGDGALDAHDLDDDGDGLSDRREADGVPTRDTDGDGVRDGRDLDSDDDGVLDAAERDDDTDGDGVPDARDLDSDDDGISDRIEGGAPPPDHDGDGVADFRDPDSDDDGLSDRDETGALGTSPRSSDTDGDGATDLIEVAAGTDPALDADNPNARGHFVFVVPHRGAPSPASDTLRFRTHIQSADLYFLFDRSGSMGGEIDALRGAVTELLGELTCGGSDRACTRDGECDAGEICGLSHRCLEDPSIAGCVASPRSGAGHYLGEYVNLLGIQPDPSRTRDALAFSVTGSTEALYRAVWGVADPVGAPGLETACVSGGIGCPAFRSDAVRILVAFTDEDSDGAETVDAAARALSDAGITTVGVFCGSPTDPARGALVALAERSGSVDASGHALVFDGADAAVVPVVASAIRTVVQGVPLRVTITAHDEPMDDGDALPFIEALAARSERCGGAATVDTDGDGGADTYPAVVPGAAVCWDVTPATNDFVPSTRAPQLFRARLEVRGNGSLLDERHVYFLVPPEPPAIDVPE